MVPPEGRRFYRYCPYCAATMPHVQRDGLGLCCRCHCCTDPDPPWWVKVLIVLLFVGSAISLGIALFTR